jgi:hypothetical protein
MTSKAVKKVLVFLLFCAGFMAHVPPIKADEAFNNEMLAIATARLTQVGYKLDGMVGIVDENNALCKKRWDEILLYIPEGASPPNPKPEDRPELIGKNYQAVYFRHKQENLREGWIWVFVDRDTKKVIFFQEEAN